MFHRPLIEYTMTCHIVPHANHTPSLPLQGPECGIPEALWGSVSIITLFIDWSEGREEISLIPMCELRHFNRVPSSRRVYNPTGYARAAWPCTLYRESFPYLLWKLHALLLEWPCG